MTFRCFPDFSFWLKQRCRLFGYYFPILGILKSSLQWESIFINQDLMGLDEILIEWWPVIAIHCHSNYQVLESDDYPPIVEHGHDSMILYFSPRTFGKTYLYIKNTHISIHLQYRINVMNMHIPFIYLYNIHIIYYTYINLGNLQRPQPRSPQMVV